MTAVLRSVQDGGAAALRMGEFVAMECSIEFRLLLLLYSLILLAGADGNEETSSTDKQQN